MLKIAFFDVNSLMKVKKYILSVVGLFLFCSVIAVWFGYKPILRWQVEKRFHGIKVHDLSLNLSGVTLKEVTVNRDWVQGNLNTVTSDFQGKHILIDGGSLSLNLDARQKQKEDTEGQKRDIQFHSLNMNVSYHEHKFSLKEVRSSGDKICFSEAKVENPSLATTSGCVEKETKIVEIDKAKLDEFNFMGAQLKDLSASKVKFNLNEKSAEINSLTTQLTFEKQTASMEVSNVKISKSEKLIQLDTVSVVHPWLAPDATTFKDVRVQYLDKLNVSLGSSHVEAETDTLSLSGSEDCSTWIDSMPDNLKSTTLQQAKFTGKVSFQFGLRPKPTFNLKSDCKAVCSSLPNLRAPFSYTAYSPKRDPFERKSGPRTAEWVSIKFMGDMPLAVKTMEDPGFYSHNGFISQAFSNSLIDNLNQGKFLRGGSTITMQLVKNIWLTRDKTLGRKVQEFFLAQAVESCYSKEEILELYLNVVEFGPNKYGAASGSQHWFQKSPGELTPQEAFWMASILPRPSRTSPPNETSLAHIEDLLKKLSKDGKIPEPMLDQFVPFEEEDQEN